jgi:hypothetical protein
VVGLDSCLVSGLAWVFVSCASASVVLLGVLLSVSMSLVLMFNSAVSSDPAAKQHKGITNLLQIDLVCCRWPFTWVESITRCEKC